MSRAGRERLAYELCAPARSPAVQESSTQGVRSSCASRKGVRAPCISSARYVCHWGVPSISAWASSPSTRARHGVGPVKPGRCEVGQGGSVGVGVRDAGRPRGAGPGFSAPVGQGLLDGRAVVTSRGRLLRPGCAVLSLAPGLLRPRPQAVRGGRHRALPLGPRLPDRSRDDVDQARRVPGAGRLLDVEGPPAPDPVRPGPPGGLHDEAVAQRAFVVMVRGVRGGVDDLREPEAPRARTGGGAPPSRHGQGVAVELRLRSRTPQRRLIPRSFHPHPPSSVPTRRVMPHAPGRVDRGRGHDGHASPPRIAERRRLRDP